MSDFLAPHTLEYSLKVPHDPFVILLWILWFGALVFLTFRFRTQASEFGKKTLIWLAGLSLSVLIFTPYFGIPLGNQDLEGFQHYFMFFVAVPWMIAGGVMGTLPAVLLAGMSGLLTAYLDTHSIFTPLLFMSAALGFSLCVRQRYRTFIYQLLRFPLIAALVSGMVAVPFLFLALLFSGSDGLAEQITIVLEGFSDASLSFIGMMLVGGVVSSFVRFFTSKAWGTQDPLQPAPSEVSLKFRWMTVAVPILLVLLLTLIGGSWATAEKNARRAMIDQLTDTANLASGGLAVFIETGESLILEIAGNEVLGAGAAESLPDELSQEMDGLPFFDNLAVVNLNGEVVAVYPSGTPEDLSLISEDISALQSSGDEIVLLTPVVSSNGGDRAARVNFLTGLRDTSGQVSRVLWGQVELTTNKYFQQVIELLEEMESDGGTGQVIGEDGLILYHTDSQQMMGTYGGAGYTTATFFEETLSDGQAWMQYYQPLDEVGWAVVTAFPLQSVKTTAWQTISPALWISIIGILILNAAMLVYISMLDKEVQELETAADKLTRGDFPVDLSGKRPRGGMRHLKQTFQRMAVSIQKKDQKQSDLLSLTERITGQLSLKDSLQIVLMAAMERGVSSARIVLLDTSGEDDPQSPGFRFGLGEHNRLLATFDQDILALAKSQGSFLFRDSQIEKMLDIQKGMPIPASLIAVPLKWKDSWLGALWVTYRDQRNPGAVEVEFFTDLSKKASVAIINARAFDKSITIKNQLETVLDVMLDPVLVLDDFGRIVYLNRAAQSMIGQGKSSRGGMTLSSAIQDKGLLSFLHEARHATRSSELRLNDGHTYHVLANPIQIEDRQMGLAVLFKDITAYKARELQKAELVTTVNHELRAPLALVHGYAKLLSLTGNLSENQRGYVNNIIEGVEEMKDLVQNLLDLDRLENAKLMKITRVNAGGLLKKAVDGLAAQSKRKNIQVGVSSPDEPIIVEADAPYLTQALKNLVENAIKFSKMGDSVNVGVSREGNSAVFQVSDTGIGIAPLDQKHLFERFYRTSNQTGEEQKGTGLGLAIVKSIAERHHGKVWVESKLGKGSTFYMRIPLKQASPVE